MKKLKCIRTSADVQKIKRAQLKLSENEKALKHYAEMMNAIGNEVRLQILFLLLEEEPLCPCDLSDILQMTVPAVSQHLKRLKQAHLVTTKREAQTIYYSIVKQNIKLVKSIFKPIYQSLQNQMI